MYMCSISVDDIAPIIAQAEDITVTVPLGSPGRTVDYPEPTATDNSGIATLVSRTRAPNDFFPVGSTPVTYTFSDPSGNTASVTFNVNVVEGMNMSSSQCGQKSFYIGLLP